MKIGLYFGSFNPIHNGHLIIAQHILNENRVDEVWFIVSPQNPFKPANTLLNEQHRYFLVQEALNNVPKMKASNVEFKLPKPSYTVNTLAYLKEKYPLKDFEIIIGSDSFQNIVNWKNSEVIIKNYPLIVYTRPSFPVTNTYGATVKLTNAPLLEISSTYIRQLIKEKKSIKFLVPEKVEIEIDRNGYYKN